MKLDCPYFRLELMPTWTREPLTQWLAKVRAWEAGWQDQQHSRARM
nr:CrpP-related protein [Achromobacter insuavis]